MISASNHGRQGRNTRNVSTSFNQTQKLKQDYASNLDLSDQLANDSVIMGTGGKPDNIPQLHSSYPEHLVKDLLDADEEIRAQDLPAEHNAHHVVSD